MAMEKKGEKENGKEERESRLMRQRKRRENEKRKMRQWKRKKERQ